MAPEAPSTPVPPDASARKKHKQKHGKSREDISLVASPSSSGSKHREKLSKKRPRESSDTPAAGKKNKKNKSSSSKQPHEAPNMGAAEQRDEDAGDLADGKIGSAGTAAAAAKGEKKKEALPVVPWMREPVRLEEFVEQPLSDVYGLHPRLKAALQEMNIESLFPVQAAVWLETIGPGSFERDICVNSPTGSGKTLAYALPIVQMLAKCKIRCLRALVVVPTRLLALQVRKVFDDIAPAMGLSVASAIGQSSIADETAEIFKKPKFEWYSPFDPEYRPIRSNISADILVATPGKLMDYISMNRGFTLEHLQYLVIDETDRLLRVEYQSWLPTVIQLTRSADQESSGYVCTKISELTSLTTTRRCGVQRGFKDKCYPRLVKIVLSATLTQDPNKLSLLDLHHPLLMTFGRFKMPEGLKFYKMICKLDYKPLYLYVLLQHLKGEKCLVFTNSADSTHRLSTLLRFFEDKSFQFSALSSLQHGKSSIQTLESFKKGKIHVLIATDVLARGVDDETIKNVINYDMPQYANTYIHRAGRTARAGQEGCCFTLMEKHEVKQFNKMLSKVQDVNPQDYSLPQELINCHLPQYTSALDKAKAYFNSDSSRGSTLKLRRGPSKTRKLNHPVGEGDAA